MSALPAACLDRMPAAGLDVWKGMETVWQAATYTLRAEAEQTQLPAFCSCAAAAESVTSKAQQEMDRLQQQVTAVEQQLDTAKDTAAQRKAAEREAEGRLEDAKAQLQVTRPASTACMHAAWQYNLYMLV